MAAGLIHCCQVHSTQLGDLFKERQNYSHNHQLQSPNKLLGLIRIGACDEATVSCLQAESTKMCAKQQNVVM